MKLRLRMLVVFFIITIIPSIVLFISLSRAKQEDFYNLLISSIAILVCVAFLMLIWVYSYILNPLSELQDATRKIKEGNLNFTLDISSYDEISELCQDFEDMRIRLKENEENKLIADRENRELLVNISHDLKTPITAIKGYIEGIMDGIADTPDKLERYVRTIYNKANDMDKLIDELTFYTKIENNTMLYSPKVVNILDFFKDCVEEIGIELDSAGIELFFDNNISDDTKAIIDVEQMKRVINNIVGNSVKYMDKEKGEFIINLSDEGDFIRIEMIDNGKGISKEDLPFIFDRFFRADSSRNSIKGGSGIGLSIVKKIIEAHGARIWAKSEEGIGTNIIIILRRYQENIIYG